MATTAAPEAAAAAPAPAMALKVKNALTNRQQMIRKRITSFEGLIAECVRRKLWREADGPCKISLLVIGEPEPYDLFDWEDVPLDFTGHLLILSRDEQEEESDVDAIDARPAPGNGMDVDQEHAPQHVAPAAAAAEPTFGFVMVPEDGSSSSVDLSSQMSGMQGLPAHTGSVALQAQHASAPPPAQAPSWDQVDPQPWPSEKDQLAASVGPTSQPDVDGQQPPPYDVDDTTSQMWTASQQLQQQQPAPVASTPAVTPTPVVSTPMAAASTPTTNVVSTPVGSTPVVAAPVVSTPVVSTPRVSTPLAAASSPARKTAAAAAATSTRTTTAFPTAADAEPITFADPAAGAAEAAQQLPDDAATESLVGYLLASFNYERQCPDSPSPFPQATVHDCIRRKVPQSIKRDDLGNRFDANVAAMLIEHTALTQMPPAQAGDETAAASRAEHLAALVYHARQILRGINPVDLRVVAQLIDQTTAAAAEVRGKHALVLVGSTGAGKSTSLQYLYGVRMVRQERTTTRADGSRLRSRCIVGENVPAGLQHFQIGTKEMSCTRTVNAVAVPNVYLNEPGDLVFCDTPGFDDNEGPEFDIANGIGLGKTLKACGSVRLVCLFGNIGDRLEVVGRVSQTLVRMFASRPRVYHDSIGFGFTRGHTADSVFEIPHRLHLQAEAAQKTTKAIDPATKDLTEHLIQYVNQAEANQQPLVIQPLDPSGREGHLRRILQQPPIEHPDIAFQNFISEDSLAALRLQFAGDLAAVRRSLRRMEMDRVASKMALLKKVVEFLGDGTPEGQRAYQDCKALLREQIEAEQQRIIKLTDRIVAPRNHDIDADADELFQAGLAMTRLETLRCCHFPRATNLSEYFVDMAVKCYSTLCRACQEAVQFPPPDPSADSASSGPALLPPVPKLAILHRAFRDAAAKHPKFASAHSLSAKTEALLVSLYTHVEEQLDLSRSQAQAALRDANALLAADAVEQARSPPASAAKAKKGKKTEGKAPKPTPKARVVLFDDTAEAEAAAAAAKSTATGAAAGADSPAGLMSRLREALSFDAWVLRHVLRGDEPEDLGEPALPAQPAGSMYPALPPALPPAPPAFMVLFGGMGVEAVDAHHAECRTAFQRFLKALFEQTCGLLNGTQEASRPVMASAARAAVEVLIAVAEVAAKVRVGEPDFFDAKRIESFFLRQTAKLGAAAIAASTSRLRALLGFADEDEDGQARSPDATAAAATDGSTAPRYDSSDEARLVAGLDFARVRHLLDTATGLAQLPRVRLAFDEGDIDAAVQSTWPLIVQYLGRCESSVEQAVRMLVSGGPPVAASKVASACHQLAAAKEAFVADRPLAGEMYDRTVERLVRFAEDKHADLGRAAYAVEDHAALAGDFRVITQIREWLAAPGSLGGPEFARTMERTCRLFGDKVAQSAKVVGALLAEGEPGTLPAPAALLFKAFDLFELGKRLFVANLEAATWAQLAHDVQAFVRAFHAAYRARLESMVQSFPHSLPTLLGQVDMEGKATALEEDIRGLVDMVEFWKAHQTLASSEYCYLFRDLPCALLAELQCTAPTQLFDTDAATATPTAPSLAMVSQSPVPSPRPRPVQPDHVTPIRSRQGPGSTMATPLGEFGSEEGSPYPPAMQTKGLPVRQLQFSGGSGAQQGARDGGASRRPVPQPRPRQQLALAGTAAAAVPSAPPVSELAADSGVGSSPLSLPAYQVVVQQCIDGCFAAHERTQLATLHDRCMVLELLDRHLPEEHKFKDLSGQVGHLLVKLAGDAKMDVVRLITADEWEEAAAKLSAGEGREAALDDCDRAEVLGRAMTQARRRLANLSGALETIASSLDPELNLHGYNLGGSDDSLHRLGDRRVDAVLLEPLWVPLHSLAACEQHFLRFLGSDDQRLLLATLGDARGRITELILNEVRRAQAFVKAQDYGAVEAVLANAKRLGGVESLALLDVKDAALPGGGKFCAILDDAVVGLRDVKQHKLDSLCTVFDEIASAPLAAPRAPSTYAPAAGMDIAEDGADDVDVRSRMNGEHFDQPVARRRTNSAAAAAAAPAPASTGSTWTWASLVSSSSSSSSSSSAPVPKSGGGGRPAVAPKPTKGKKGKGPKVAPKPAGGKKGQNGGGKPPVAAPRRGSGVVESEAGPPEDPSRPLVRFREVPFTELARMVADPHALYYDEYHRVVEQLYGLTLGVIKKEFNNEACTDKWELLEDVVRLAGLLRSYYPESIYERLERDALAAFRDKVAKAKRDSQRQLMEMEKNGEMELALPHLFNAFARHNCHQVKEYLKAVQEMFRRHIECMHADLKEGKLSKLLGYLSGALVHWQRYLRTDYRHLIFGYGYPSLWAENKLLAHVRTIHKDEDLLFNLYAAIEAHLASCCHSMVAVDTKHPDALAQMARPFSALVAALQLNEPDNSVRNRLYRNLQSNYLPPKFEFSDKLALHALSCLQRAVREHAPRFNEAMRRAQETQHAAALKRFLETAEMADTALDLARTYVGCPHFTSFVPAWVHNKRVLRGLPAGAGNLLQLREDVAACPNLDAKRKRIVPTWKDLANAIMRRFIDDERTKTANAGERDAYYRRVWKQYRGLIALNASLSEHISIKDTNELREQLRTHLSEQILVFHRKVCELSKQFNIGLTSLELAQDFNVAIDNLRAMTDQFDDSALSGEAASKVHQAQTHFEAFVRQLRTAAFATGEAANWVLFLIHAKTLATSIPRFAGLLDGAIDGFLQDILEDDQNGRENISLISHRLERNNKHHRGIPMLLISTHKAFAFARISIDNAAATYGIHDVLGVDAKGRPKPRKAPARAGPADEPDYEREVERIDGDGVNAKALLDAYNIYLAVWEAIVKDGMSNPEFKLSGVIAKALELAATKKSSGQYATLIPKLLGHIFAWWTLTASLGHSGGSKAELTDEAWLKKKKESRQPHPAQVVAILRLLCIASKGRTIELSLGKLENHMVQILTGEGKSVVLAVVSTVLALFNFQVDCACYSKYLSERDHKAFHPMFAAFGVHLRVKYGTFARLCEDVINGEGDVRRMAEATLAGQDLKGIAKTRDPRKRILLIDEVDVFFSESFLGKTYNPIARLQDDAVSDMIHYAWKVRHEPKKVRYEAFTASKPCQRFLKRFAAWPTLMANLVRVMLHELRPYADAKATHDYVRLRTSIAYKHRDGLSDKKSFGFSTVFAYHKEYEHHDGITDSKLEQETFIPIHAGSFSYDQIPKQYTKIMGVTGTLKQLGKEQLDLIRTFGINKLTYIPSSYGASQRDCRATVIVGDREHHTRVVSEINSGLKTLGRTDKRNEKSRAVLVFFESIAALEEFRESNAAKGGLNLSAIRYLTEEQPTSTHDRDAVIAAAVTAGAVTFLTRAFGRGTDFFCYDPQVIAAGGVHVIQTFLSADVAEEAQIKGRTARQSNRGSYIKILNATDLEYYGVNAAAARDLTKVGDTACNRTLHEARCRRFEEKHRTTCASMVQTLADHKASQQFAEALLARKTAQVAAFLEERHPPPPVTPQTHRTIVLIDATGSMATLLEKTKTTVRQMVSEVSQVLAGTPHSAELQFATYRNYNSNRMDGLLSFSPWAPQTDATSLDAFLGNTRASGGSATTGNEAVEVGLAHVMREHQTSEIGQVVLIGDYPPNKYDEVVSNRAASGEEYWSSRDWDWIRTPSHTDAEVKRLADAGIKVHALYLRSIARESFGKIASATGGRSFELDISSSSGAESLQVLICKSVLEGVGPEEEGKHLFREYCRRFDHGFVA